jgi:hypothetical protein
MLLDKIGFQTIVSGLGQIHPHSTLPARQPKNPPAKLEKRSSLIEGVNCVLMSNLFCSFQGKQLKLELLIHKNYLYTHMLNYF